MFDQPTPSQTLRILRALNNRKPMIAEEELRKKNQERGLAGECKLHTLLQGKLTSPAISLYGIQLQHGSNEFQLDALLIFQNAIHLLEVKNHYGNFIVDDERWYYASTINEVSNPLHQLSRADMMLTAFLKQRHIDLPVISHLIFMDANFYLYGANVDMPIIFPGQHEMFLKKLNTEKRPLGVFHERVADTLTSAHITQSRHEYIPAYSYANLNKGIFCKSCSRIIKNSPRKYFTCEHCSEKESIEKALLRSINDFQILYPNENITMQAVMDWIGHTISKSTVRRHLNKYFTSIKQGRGSYYVRKMHR